jgi:hypothetical protein
MIAQLNSAGLVLSVFADDEHSPQAQLFVMSTGTRLITLPDNGPHPTPGQKYDDASRTFVDDAGWLTEKHEALTAQADALQTLADVEAAKLKRLQALPADQVHPSEIDAAAQKQQDATAAAAATLADIAVVAAKVTAAGGILTAGVADLKG